jgi:predicted ATPase
MAKLLILTGGVSSGKSTLLQTVFDQAGYKVFHECGNLDMILEALDKQVNVAVGMFASTLDALKEDEKWSILLRHHSVYVLRCSIEK